MSCCTTKVVTICIDSDLSSIRTAMNYFILYGTLGCHLCDEAEALLTPLLTSACNIECIDISESDQLVEQYGALIPVLRRLHDNAELRWPFDAAQARPFLAAI